MEKLLLDGSLGSMRRAINAKTISVSEIAKWYLARIESLDRSGPRLNAIRTIAPDALEVARQLDNEVASGRIRGPLHGIPVVLKDNILTGDGMTATAGAAALAGFNPVSDATLVRRLRQAGALILGKTNLTEFADYVSEVMPSGFSGAGGMVKNPHGIADYGRGLGSSVGSAAAVAAALAPIAIGSETQNSNSNACERVVSFRFQAECRDGEPGWGGSVGSSARFARPAWALGAKIRRCSYRLLAVQTRVTP